MKAGDTIELRPGMTKTVLETGSGERAKEGNIVQIDYKGSLDNGTVFDSSHGKKPLKFRIGNMEVIRGMDIGVETMSVGEKSVLHIPPALAYGDAKVGPIPPRSDLTFEIKLISAYDDTFDQVKRQIFFVILVMIAIVIAAPIIQDHGHHGMTTTVKQFWMTAFKNVFGS